MKVAIIGIGSVGSAVATAVKNTGLVHELVLFDRDAIRAMAAAEDLGHATAFNFDIKITAVSNYRDIRGSEIVIIAAGANQKPGQTRTDLLENNIAVISDIIPQVIANTDKDKVKLILVTNPLDVMVTLAQKLSNLPADRIIGTGTMLDTARLRTILSRHLSVSPQSICSYVLGEHGDSSVINWSACNIGGIPLNEFCKQTKIHMTVTTKRTIEHRVHNAAYEIIRGRGATWDGIGAAVADLLRCIINDENRILTVSCVSLGLRPFAMSLPRIIGHNGVVATLNPNLDANETILLKQSSKIIQTNCKNIK